MGVGKARRGFRQVGSNNVVWDAPAITPGGGVQSTTLSVPGAKVGDAVVVTPDLPTNGVVYGGYVSGVSTVTLTALNVTSSSVNPPATGYAVVVFRP